jgi:chemotaxis protein MotB
MKACFGAGVLGGLVLALASGCGLVTQSQLAAVQSQNRVLTDQNRAQLEELSNLKVHARQTEDQLRAAEKKMAALEDQVGLGRQQLSNFERERHRLHQEVKGLVDARGPLSPEMNRYLADLSARHPGLRFDAETGVGKFDTDILFDDGKAELKDGADRVLNELATVLKSPDANQLKVFVVGHTDDRPIAKKPAREQYASNFDLSTARAHAVADRLRRLGVEDARLGVAGFGSHEPVAVNVSPRERQKNRRVEIFVMAPETPVVGWTDTMPRLY